MTGIEGLARRFQSDPLAGADNQYTHDWPFISESMPPTLLKLGSDVAVDCGDRQARTYRESAVDAWLGAR